MSAAVRADAASTAILRGAFGDLPSAYIDSGLREMPKDRPPFMAIGIDFGTTFTGVAWAYESSVVEPIKVWKSLAHDTPVHPQPDQKTARPRLDRRPRNLYLPNPPPLLMIRSKNQTKPSEPDRQHFYRKDYVYTRSFLTSTASDFSAGRRERFVEGYTKARYVEAVPDSGADSSFISPKLAAELGLVPNHQRSRAIYLPNKIAVVSPGPVEIPWRFKGEKASCFVECWIFPGLIHDLVLGGPFLKLSQTLTAFKHRIKSRVRELSKRLRLRLLGCQQERLYGLLNGTPTLALPDTGSDVMLISRDYAQQTGLTVDWDCGNWLEVEYANGNTDWTCGVARNVSWTMGGKRIICDFHVLEDLSVDVVLSNDFLFNFNVFSEHEDCFIDVGSDHESFCRFYGIRLLRNPQSDPCRFQILDVTSPDAFGRPALEREWARRDRARDEIAKLPEDHRDAALQAEAEEQRRWEQLRQAHRERWSSLQPATPPLDPIAQAHSSRGGGSNSPSQDRSIVKWRDRIRVALPGRYLRRPRPPPPEG